MKKRFFTNEAGVDMVEITTPDRNSVIRRATDEDHNLDTDQHPGPSIGNSSGHPANVQTTPIPEKPVKADNEANDFTADPPREDDGQHVHVEQVVDQPVHENGVKGDVA